MLNKWWMVILGVAAFQETGVFASEHKPINSPRNPLGCSQEVQKEVQLAAAQKRSNSGSLTRLSKENIIFCNGSIGSRSYYYGLDTKDTRPYFADFPGQNFSGY